MKNIIIMGRRWFDTGPGNTYHKVSIFIDGKLVYTSPDIIYGYDDHYIQTATAWLEGRGYIPDLEHYPNGGSEALWRYCERKGLEYKALVSDVKRKSDL